MNPLNWLPFVGEDRQDNPGFDPSLVLPLSVGLGTVMVSVFLGYRGGIRSSVKKTTSPQTTLEMHVPTNAIREVAKRKSTVKTNKVAPPQNNAPPKSSSSSSSVDRSAGSAPTISQSTTRPPIPNGGLPERKPTPTSLSVSIPPVVTDDKSSRTSSASVTQSPSIITTTTTTTTVAADGWKKSKKPRRSRRPEMEKAPAQMVEEDDVLINEADPSWVTVKPKKAKHTPSLPVISKAPKSKESCPPSPTSASVRAVEFTTVSTTSQSSLSVSCEPSPIMPSVARGSEKTSKPIPSTRVVIAATVNPTVSSAPPSRVVAPVVVETSVCQPSDEVPPVDATRPLVHEITSNQEVHAVSQPSAIGTQPVHVQTRLPAAQVHFPQHLAAQTQAKELECQLLRDEVLYLRDEVKRIATANRSSVRVEHANMETQASLLDSEPSEVTRETRLPSPALVAPVTVAESNASTHSVEPAHRVDSCLDTDAVLLSTLQDEISRLAKELTLSRQRNENLESRLENNKTQLTVAKKKTAQDTKSIRQQVQTETERAVQAEHALHETQTRLQDVLQQFESQRNQIQDSEVSITQQLERSRGEYAQLLTEKEQWVEEQTRVRHEKDQLALQCDQLKTSHEQWVEEQTRLRHEKDQLAMQCDHLKTSHEQWMEEQTRIHHEKDQLALQCDQLKASQEAFHTELEREKQQTNELHAQLLEANKIVELASTDRDTNQQDAQTRIAQLEAQLSVALEERTVGEQSIRAELNTQIDGLNEDAKRLHAQLVERDRTMEELRSKCEVLERRIEETPVIVEHAPALTEAIQAKKDSPPCLVEAENHMASSTQTDNGIEFDSVLVDPMTTSGTILQTRKEPQSQSQSSIPGENGTAQTTDYCLQVDQVSHYNSALDETEAMLSKLQQSVDDEEQRWRAQLEASRMESELLESKVKQLQSTLSELVHERDGLAKMVQEYDPDLRAAELQSNDGRSSVHSLSITRLVDQVRYDENSSKPDLIRLLNRFRYLVQVEHEALKKTQTKMNLMQTELNSTKSAGASGTASPSAVPLTKAAGVAGAKLVNGSNGSIAETPHSPSNGRPANSSSENGTIGIKEKRNGDTIISTPFANGSTPCDVNGTDDFKTVASDDPL